MGLSNFAAWAGRNASRLSVQAPLAQIHLPSSVCLLPVFRRFFRSGFGGRTSSASISFTVGRLPLSSLGNVSTSLVKSLAIRRYGTKELLSQAVADSGHSILAQPARVLHPRIPGQSARALPRSMRGANNPIFFPFGFKPRISGSSIPHPRTRRQFQLAHHRIHASTRSIT